MGKSNRKGKSNQKMKRSQKLKLNRKRKRNQKKDSSVLEGMGNGGMSQTVTRDYYLWMGVFFCLAFWILGFLDIGTLDSFSLER